MEENDLKRFWELMQYSGHGLAEIRVIDVNRSKILGIGFFEEPGELIKAVRKYDGVANAYIGRNPRKFDLRRSPAYNNILPISKGGSADDVLYLSALSLDIDPVIRMEGVPADEEEHKLVCDISLKLAYDYDNSLVIDSGNGTQIIFLLPLVRVQDIPVSNIIDWEKEMIERIEEEGQGRLKVDPTQDIARIIKLPGLMSVKGISREDRPHRRVRIIYTAPDIKYSREFLLDILNRETKKSLEISPPIITGLKDDLLPCMKVIYQEGVEEGYRDESAFRLAIQFRNKGIPREGVEVMLLAWNRKNRPPLEDKIIMQKVEGAFKVDDTKGSYAYSSYGCEFLASFCSPQCPIKLKEQSRLSAITIPVKNIPYKGSDNGKKGDSEKVVCDAVSSLINSGYEFVYSDRKDTLYLRNGKGKDELIAVDSVRFNAIVFPFLRSLPATNQGKYLWELMRVVGYNTSVHLGESPLLEWVEATSFIYALSRSRAVSCEADSSLKICRRGSCIAGKIDLLSQSKVFEKLNDFDLSEIFLLCYLTAGFLTSDIPPLIVEEAIYPQCQKIEGKFYPGGIEYVNERKYPLMLVRAAKSIKSPTVCLKSVIGGFKKNLDLQESLTLSSDELVTLVIYLAAMSLKSKATIGKGLEFPYGEYFKSIARVLVVIANYMEIEVKDTLRGWIEEVTATEMAGS